MKIAIGGDHASPVYKNSIQSMLIDLGHEVIDFGTYTEDSVDYPDFAHPVAKSVVSKEVSLGILICGSGNGVAITANKYPSIRAALCWNSEIASLARQHNDANILCLPARFIDLDLAKSCVKVFVNTEFEGGRHATRVSKISC
ncbi:MAG: ribose 5-phosphate isomerase B [Cytophagales bacterium]|nr:MAG: ribose 5-phosphate isomerase B [Cytophagales bacterium]